MLETVNLAMHVQTTLIFAVGRQVKNDFSRKSPVFSSFDRASAFIRDNLYTCTVYTDAHIRQAFFYKSVWLKCSNKLWECIKQTSCMHNLVLKKHTAASQWSVYLLQGWLRRRQRESSMQHSKRNINFLPANGPIGTCTENLLLIFYST